MKGDFDRVCESCGEDIFIQEPDPCIGQYLPGVAHACCGHGDESKAYCNGFDGCKPHDCVTDINADHFTSRFLLHFDEDGEPVELSLNPEWTEEKDKKNMMPGYWVKKGKEAIEYINSLKSK